MPSLYFAPISVSYLTLFILALAITLFLLNRLRSQPSRSLLFMSASFVPMTILTAYGFSTLPCYPFSDC